MHTYWYDKVRASLEPKSCYHKSNICHFGNGTENDYLQRYSFVCMDKILQEIQKRKKIIRFPCCSVAYLFLLYIPHKPLASTQCSRRFEKRTNKIGINKWWINDRNAGATTIQNENKYKIPINNCGFLSF